MNHPSPSRERPVSTIPALRPAALGCALALVLILAACGADARRAGSGDRSGGGAPPPVEVVPARSGALPLTEELSGVVRARNQVPIRPEISAQVVAVEVRTGDSVERGQPLVRLEDDALREQLREAQANLRLAEASAAEARASVAELEARARRSRALAEEDLIPQVDLETLEAQLDGARARAAQADARVEQTRAAVDERRSALSKTVVRAPITGRVGRRDAEVGMLVDPGTTLFMIGDFDDLIVEVPITEEMLGYLREGMPVLVHPRGGEPAGGPDGAPRRRAPIEEELSRISPFLEQESFSTRGEIDLDNSALPPERRLRPGMFVTVEVLYGQSERATLVPATALWEDPRTSIRGIYVVRGLSGAAPPGEPGELSEETYPVEFRRVEVLAEGKGRLGVSGIEEDEWVVTVGQQLLSGAGEGLVGEAQGGGEGEAAPAETGVRVRPTTWDRVLALQSLQREDVLRAFLDKQKRMARTLGAEIPSLAEMELGGSGVLGLDRSQPAPAEPLPSEPAATDGEES